MINVKEYFLENLGKEELNSDPIILSIVNDDLNFVRQKFTSEEIHNAYRKLSLKYYPDLYFGKSKEEVDKYANIFGKIHEVYYSLNETNSPANLPYAIDDEYYDIPEEFETVLTYHKLWHWAVISKCSQKDANEIFFSDSWHKTVMNDYEMRNPTAVKDYFKKCEDKKLNEDLGEVEFSLQYGYVDPDEYHMPFNPGSVAIKHLKKATNNFGMLPKNEWIFVDRKLSADLKNKTADITPHTVVRQTYDNWLFVALHPFYKLLIPNNHVLIPSYQYADALGSSLVGIDRNDLPMKEKSEAELERERLMENLLKKGGLYWVCLSPHQQKILNDYPFSELEEKQSLMLSESN